ncbi:MAG: hypothetical protein AAGK05_09355 [Pseudomonadota bacterium]
MDEEHVTFIFPHNTHRKPRPLSVAKQWKAVEWKNFLLYTGPVILKGKLPRDYYEHFLLLSAAISILCEESSCESAITTAEEMLHVFHNCLGDLYENSIYSFNMHSLLHLAAQVRRKGSLSKCSAFVFENAMGKLVSYAKTGQCTIDQIVNGFLHRRITPCHTSLNARGVGEPLKRQNSLKQVASSAVHVYSRAFVNGYVFHSLVHRTKKWSCVVALHDGTLGRISYFFENHIGELYVELSILKKESFHPQLSNIAGFSRDVS